MQKALKNKSLTIALSALFLFSIVGQSVAGWRALAEELRYHAAAPVGFLDYLTTGHFLSATFENWESEFLQMTVYVLLTAMLFQTGSPESKKPEGGNPENEAPEGHRPDPEAPWPVHKGGLLLRLYSHSLGIALALLFALSFALHLAGSMRRSNEEAARHQQPPKTLTETMVEPEFWYESFQNWQSEFLSMGVLVMFGIFLRERGSPESKPVAAPHAKTGH